MKISIVIPTYGRFRSLAHMLESLHDRIPVNVDNEIIIVDDCSAKKIREKKRQLCQQYMAHLIQSPRHRGPAAARNLGIGMARGEWVAFLDDDVVVDRQWYSTLVLHIANAPDTVVGLEGATIPAGDGIWDREVENRFGGLYLSCNIAYRKKDLVRENGFDEAFSGPHAEDQELALRLMQWGSIEFMNDTVVYHLPREQKPIVYILFAVKRMKNKIMSEWHLYAKHPDRYHTIRFNPTFRHTYTALLFRHCIITLKRRSFRQYNDNPFQSMVLFISTVIEQGTAWFLLPFIINRIHRYYAGSLPSSLDHLKTKALWLFRDDASLRALVLQPKIIPPFLKPFLPGPIYDMTTVFDKTKHLTEMKIPCVYVRIDDLFLHDTAAVRRFCALLAPLRVPFLAGVTGNDLTAATSAVLLEEIAGAGGRIAVHGFCHHGTFGPFDSEVLQLSYPEIERKIERLHLDTVSPYLQPIGFIPPFNAITWRQIVFLGSYFPIVCGGPETLRFTYYITGPVSLSSGAVYFPSFHPYYDTARNIAKKKVVHALLEARAPVCITLHFQREQEDHFASLYSLLSLIKSLCADWTVLTSESAPGVDKQTYLEPCERPEPAAPASKG